MKYINENGINFLFTKIKNLFVPKSQGNKKGILKGNGSGGLSVATSFSGKVTTSSTGDYVLPSHTHTWDTFPDLKTIYFGITVPSDTKVFWVDPNEGVKFYTGSAWKLVPGAYK